MVLFETHGESLGRGGHPDGLSERFAYLDPPAVRAAFARHGIRTRLETSFQGGDGYLNFGAPALAHAAVARIAEHAFAPRPPTARFPTPSTPRAASPPTSSPARAPP